MTLTACGSSDEGPNSSASLSLSKQSVDFYGQVNGTSPNHEIITGSLSGAQENVYLYVEYNENGVLYGADVSTSGTKGTLYLYPKSPNELGEGDHSDTVTVKACNDVNCSSHISGSPKQIKINYQVAADFTTIDTDQDGVADYLDAFPNDPKESKDENNDGLGDNTDSDGDGVADIDDAFPLNDTEISDVDQDGLGNNADSDDDNDGVDDAQDYFPHNAEVSSQFTELTFNVTGKGEITVNDKVIDCDSSCVVTLENSELAVNNTTNISITATEHYTFDGIWNNQELCLDVTDSCALNSSHLTKQVFTLNFAEDENIIINASTTIGGGIIEKFGLLSCSESCEEKLYQPQLASITLQAISQPGYTFTGWSGDCSGNVDCVLSYQANHTYTVSATYAESASSFDICPGDENQAFSGEGSIDIPAASQFVALCNGIILLADTSSNSVVVFDVINNNAMNTIQLSAEPTNLTLDKNNSLLYVTHGETSLISRVNLATEEVAELYLKDGANSIAVSDSGTVFILLNNANIVNLYNSITGMLIDSQEVLGSYISYNDATSRLITSSLNYIYQFENHALTVQGSSSGGGSGSDCNKVTVSPDGEHAALPCGAGNGAGYSVYDFYSHDPSTVLGEWQTGAYPTAASFSPSSKYVFLTNRDKLQLFSTDTHQLTFETNVNSCSYDDIEQLAVSTDSKLLLALSSCGFNNETSRIQWVAYDTK